MGTYVTKAEAGIGSLEDAAAEMRRLKQQGADKALQFGIEALAIQFDFCDTAEQALIARAMAKAWAWGTREKRALHRQYIQACKDAAEAWPNETTK